MTKKFLLGLLGVALCGLLVFTATSSVRADEEPYRKICPGMWTRCATAKIIGIPIPLFKKEDQPGIIYGVE